MNEPANPIERPFTADEKHALALLVEMVIPPSETYGVPGAGDPLILDTIVSDAGRRTPRLFKALTTLDEIAQESCGVGFAGLSVEQRGGVVDSFRESHPGVSNLIAILTTQCYYRDDRVMIALGMETRPPHPEGYVVEQGDWSLLDPVRKRAAFYRKPGQTPG
jgi:hypothetical protein